eukprot:gene16595-8021_t
MEKQAVAVVFILVALYLGVPIEIGKADGLCFGTEENKTTLCHMNGSCLGINNQSLCSCKPGFTGNGSSCHNIDECLSNKCPENSTCMDTIGSFICSCDGGYFWNGSQCVDECLTNGHKCHDHAFCSSTNGSYFCICAAGHTGNGTFCEKNYVDCTDFPGSCCASRNGFSKNDSGHCVDIDECQNGTDVCPQSSICVNTEGSYTCTCKSGFSGNGTHCQDRCRQSSCPELSFCRNIPTGPLCRCINGLYLSNELCVKAKTIFQVDGVRLNRTFIPRYADRRSSEFTELATEVESQFLRAFRGTKLGPGLKAIQIFALRRGSIVLSFYLLFDQKPTVTTTQIAELVKNRSFHLSFSPERQTRPVVRESQKYYTDSTTLPILAAKYEYFTTFASIYNKGKMNLNLVLLAICVVVAKSSASGTCPVSLGEFNTNDASEDQSDTTSALISIQMNCTGIIYGINLNATESARIDYAIGRELTPRGQNGTVYFLQGYTSVTTRKGLNVFKLPGLSFEKNDIVVLFSTKNILRDDNGSLNASMYLFSHRGFALQNISSSNKDISRGDVEAAAPFKSYALRVKVGEQKESNHVQFEFKAPLEPVQAAQIQYREGNLTGAELQFIWVDNKGEPITETGYFNINSIILVEFHGHGVAGPTGLAASSVTPPIRQRKEEESVNAYT